MNIRPATAADWHEVLVLLEGSGLPIADLDGRHLAHFLVVRDGPALAGTVAVQPHGTTGLLRSLAVDAGFRSEGLSRRLVDVAESQARADGITTLWLLTTTVALLFEKLGYVRVDRAQAPAEVQASSEFARLCPASAVCMSKKLA